jgi:hypothetical protein
LLGGFETAGLLIVVEDAGERVESFGAVGVGGELGAGGGDEGTLAVGLGEEGEVGLDEFGGPERLEGFVVDGEGGVGVAATGFNEGLGADGEDLVLRELLAVARDDGFGGGVVLLVQEELQGCGVDDGFGGITGEEGVEGGRGLSGRQALIAEEEEHAGEGAPGALLGGDDVLFAGDGWGGGDFVEGCDLLRDEQAALVEVGEF